MPKFKFSPAELKKGFSQVKVVKPQSNDICLRFLEGKLVLFCSDKRRYTRIEVPAEIIDSKTSSFSSDDFYLSMDRTSLFDSELESVIVSVNEKSISIQTTGDGQSRQATLKRRSDSSRRPKVPDNVQAVHLITINSKILDNILRDVSCSALIRETKSDEDMRVNQIHFYSDSHCVTSNARYYGSVSFHPDLNCDLSITSNDIPLILSFCSKIDKDIHLSHDATHLYVEDVETKSVIAFSKVVGKKPPLSLIDRSEFMSTVLIDQSKFAQTLEWVLLSLDGTQRASLKLARVSGPDGTMEISSGTQEIAKIPILFECGSDLQADFPVKFLSSIIHYLGKGIVAIRYGSKSFPSLLELSRHKSDDNSIESFHYLQSMKDRGTK